jgi:AcrR family transcriptional regulator
MTMTGTDPLTDSDQFLDAALRCMQQTGIRRTTMVQIADAAGVSRAWLYRNYPDKAALLGAALIRQDEAFWSGAHRRIRARRTLAGQVAEAVRYSRDQPPGTLVLELRATEPDACAALLGVGVREAMPGMALFWRPYLEQARDRGEVRDDLDIARAAEWVMRIVLSLVTVPGDAIDVDNAAAVRRFVEEFLLAGLGNCVPRKTGANRG